MESYLVLCGGDVWRKHFFFEPGLVDHDLEVDVYVLAAGHVIGLLLLFLSLEVLHLEPPFFSLLLDALYFVQGVAFLVVLSALHLRN